MHGGFAYLGQQLTGVLPGHEALQQLLLSAAADAVPARKATYGFRHCSKALLAAVIQLLSYSARN